MSYEAFCSLLTGTVSSILNQFNINSEDPNSIRTLLYEPSFKERLLELCHPKLRNLSEACSDHLPQVGSFTLYEKNRGAAEAAPIYSLSIATLNMLRMCIAGQKGRHDNNPLGVTENILQYTARIFLQFIFLANFANDKQLDFITLQEAKFAHCGIMQEKILPALFPDYNTVIPPPSAAVRYKDLLTLYRNGGQTLVEEIPILENNPQFFDGYLALYTLNRDGKKYQLYVGNVQVGFTALEVNLSIQEIRKLFGENTPIILSGDWNHVAADVTTRTADTEESILGLLTTGESSNICPPTEAQPASLYFPTPTGTLIKSAINGFVAMPASESSHYFEVDISGYHWVLQREGGYNTELVHRELSTQFGLPFLYDEKSNLVVQKINYLTRKFNADKTTAAEILIEALKYFNNIPIERKSIFIRSIFSWFNKNAKPLIAITDMARRSSYTMMSAPYEKPPKKGESSRPSRDKAKSACLFNPAPLVPYKQVTGLDYKVGVDNYSRR